MSKIWITRAELRDMIREAAGACPSDCECDECQRKRGMSEAKKKKKARNNPWAICTASVGRDSDKYEDCVMGVKHGKKKK